MFKGNHLMRKLLATVCDVQSCNYVMSTLKMNGHGRGAANYHGAGQEH